ncbi:MAG: DUF4412 domain-containing protein [Deltaproteobacteria bacterium]|nr:DUF4412 domain-containing protein [Deltaproteobacteria bacterium]
MLLSVLCGSTDAFGGYVVEQKHKTVGLRRMGEATTTSVSWEGSRVRVDDPAKQISIIIDYEASKLIALNHSLKEYRETSLEQLAAQQKKRRDSAVLKFGLLTPEQRKRVGRLELPVPVAFESTTETETIAGHTCKKFLLWRATNPAGEVCLSEQISLGPISEHVKKLAASGGTAFGGSGDMLALPEGVQMSQGFPLRTVSLIEIAAKRITTTTEVSKVEKRPLPASLFHLPPDYKRDGNDGGTAHPAQRGSLPGVSGGIGTSEGKKAN